ncbi:baseplate multidomain protein megatron [Nitratireductor sp. GCM10026969]|uniref:baseplate multidomain protein megatron n=1 Tax=Nitratireductor sp. GCM10026969 TaxID=3252645 RepID=UPI003621E638
MATIVLQAAGAFLGGALGAVGSAIGSAAGAVAGYMIDRALISSTQSYEGPRLSAARPFTGEDGAPLPRVYGTMRVGGILIWATRFEERSTSSRQGGKGGPKVTEYSYYANVAFALCKGEIAGVRRIWADGEEVDRDRVEIRVHTGSESQPVDPLIEAKQGSGNAPAYRGTAYVVIERLPIDQYGRRIPQFQFEVMRPGGALNHRIRSVALIPGSTEHGLSSTVVKETITPGETRTLNRHTRLAATDLEASLDELQMVCPNLRTVSLVVTWFGTDLRAGHCRIKPTVAREAAPRPPFLPTLPWVEWGTTQEWRVSGIEKSEADLVSRIEGEAAYGGTPSDRSVTEAIQAIRRRGWKVALYPFIMMDVPPESGLPDPYGASEQPAYPWRGRITCHPAPGRPGTPDKTSGARAQIAVVAGTASSAQFAPGEDTIVFQGDMEEWSYRRFLLHYAHLAAAAGGVDAFLLGSELRGLTTVRDEENRFPFVELLEDLAGEVRSILGSTVTITYGADWSEYFGHQPADGSGDIFFHLDSLWSHAAVDAVGIDNYMPLSDWRDHDVDGGNPDGFTSAYDPDGLKGAIASGEGFDWYYASEADRAARARSPISDGAYGKHWVFRYKDLAGWWSNPHYNRIAGVEEATPTAWIPQSKPIHFTELGCAAVDKGPNQPNVFPDPKSSENAVPYFSNGGRSDLAQYRLLLAHYRHWEDGGPAANPISPIYDGPMVDVAQISIWAWDARPFPAFPIEDEVWADGANWARGHWLNGRLSGITVGALIDTVLQDHGLGSADTARADGTLAGYVVSTPTTARAALEPVTNLFRIGVRDDGQRLVFATEGTDAGQALELDELVVPSDSETVERTRQPDHALPALAHLDFRDVLNDHQSATAAVDYLGAKGSGTQFLSFPGGLPVSEAGGLVRDYLRRVWDGRESAVFSIPATEQRLQPGSIVRLPGTAAPEYLVTEVEEGLARLVKARRFVRTAPAPASGSDLPVGGGGGELSSGKPFTLLLDLPLRTGEEPAHEQFRVAARSRPWQSQVVLASPEETGFALRSRIDRRAVMGALQEPLPESVVEGRWDRAGTALVRLYDGELQSRSRVQILNGANAAAVLSQAGVWEILQFEAAEEIEPSVWRLSGLLRGQLGTNDALYAGAQAGSPFVLLDEAVTPAGLKPEEAGLALNWRIGPAGYAYSDERFVLIGAAGGLRALRPLSPVHLKGSWRDGDLHLSWIRRGRIGADNWMAGDIPMGEAHELYRVEVAPQDGAALRTVDCTNREWTYGATTMQADFGGVPPAIDVTIRQVSATAGAGMALRRTIRTEI